MNNGKLIVIDGVDASGKQTQSLLLFDALNNKGVNVKKLSFPVYNDESSALVRMYLSGALSKNADDVNCYAASSFYAADRYASYKKTWGELYHNGATIICDRYVTSNAIHQAAKLNECDRDDYFNWLYDFEYNKLGIPKPDLVIFLDMPPEYALKLLDKRYDGDDSKKDIHESDPEFLQRSYDAAITACKHGNWYRISCISDGEIKEISVIHNEILNLADNFINGDEIKKAKKELRNIMRIFMRSIDAKTKLELDNSVYNNFINSEFYLTSDDILMYHSTNGEVDTLKIISTALKDEKNIYLPKCDKQTHTLNFYKINSLSDLVYGEYGILEPDTQKCESVTPQNDFFAVIPGMAFDSDGNRLGKGAGYYDRFLENFKGLKAGFTYSFLMEQKLYTGLFDIKMDIIINEKEVMEIERN